MTTSDLQVAHIVFLRMKAKDNPTNLNSDAQLYFTNVPMLKSGDYEPPVFYYPLLTRIDGVGSDSGEVVPLPRQGSITINDGAGTFGYERRFSDLFERYAIIGATVEIFTAFEPPTGTTLFTTATSSWTTEVRDVQRQGDDLTLYIVERGLGDQVITKIVDSTTHPDAPDSSLGKYLPIVLGGTEQVKPTQISGTSGAPVLGYATTLADDFMVSGVSAYYARNINGTYTEVRNPAATTTPLFQQTAITGNLAFVGFAALAFKLKISDVALGNYIIRGFKITLDGSGLGGSATGRLQFKIVEENPANGGPNEERVLATATIDKSLVSAAWVASSDFDLTPSFDRPAVIEPTRSYYLVCTGSNESGSSATYFKYTTSSTNYCWYKDTGTDGGGWNEASGANCDAVMEFYGVRFDDDPTPSGSDIDSTTGLGSAKISLSQTAAVAGQTNPDLSKLDLLLDINGIIDDSGGSVSGSGSSILRNPQHIIELLDYEWDGSDWTAAGRFDFSKFSSTHSAAFGGSGAYTRRISGYTTGRTTVSELMQQVCRCSASRIVRTNTASTPLALYAWGTTESTQAVISDEDSRIRAVRYYGVESVITRAVVRSKRKIANTDFSTAIAQGVGEILETVYTYDRNTGSFEGLIGATTDTYGVRELTDNDFPFLDGSTNTYSDAIGNFYLRRFNAPHVFVEIEVPFYKYSGIDNMEVVELCTPELPAFFGTSSNAKLPFYDGSEVDVLLGDYLKRFNRYRAQVEGRTLEFNVGGFPILKLNCRLLLSYPADPT